MLPIGSELFFSPPSPTLSALGRSAAFLPIEKRVNTFPAGPFETAVACKKHVSFVRILYINYCILVYYCTYILYVNNCTILLFYNSVTTESPSI